ncbi:MAG: helix-turn-helix transcriptional regulator [bacterium]|nr:helix-turn-helix transcriptional regulator [bacterium]
MTDEDDTPPGDDLSPIRSAMNTAGLSFEDVANALGVSSRAVRFWASGRSKPQAVVRPQLAKLLGVSPVDLFPADRSDLEPEVIASYDRLIDIPRNLWERLLIGAEHHVDIIAGGTRHYLEQNPDLGEVLQAKQRLGSSVTFRVCLADPTTEAIGAREEEESRYSTLVAGGLRTNTAAVLSEWQNQLDRYDSGEVRVTDVAYRLGLFRFDDEMIAQVYTFGGRGQYSAADHLQRTRQGGKFDQYVEHFERIWADASRPPPETN